VPLAAPLVLSRVDHLVYATADLDRGIAEIERLLGVRASVCGQHPTWGTRNALLPLGPRSYLEIIAPDSSHFPVPENVHLDWIEQVPHAFVHGLRTPPGLKDFGPPRFGAE
jgi:Glyoxalase-like domain